MTYVRRVVEFVTIKRNAPLTGRSYGHWWVELGDDESYGWWPARAPLGITDIIRGTPGVLNGVGVSGTGTPTRDPNHGLLADYEFQPVSVSPKTDDEIANAIRQFASTFEGEWRWSTRPTMNCRLFQLALMDVVGLVDGTGNYHTRGPGCPALAEVRRVAGRLSRRRHWPRNLPAAGQRVADVHLEPAPRGPATGVLEGRVATAMAKTLVIAVIVVLMAAGERVRRAAFVLLAGSKTNRDP